RSVNVAFCGRALRLAGELLLSVREQRSRSHVSWSGWDECLVRLAKDCSRSEIMALSLRVLRLLLRVWTQTLVEVSTFIPHQPYKEVAYGDRHQPIVVRHCRDLSEGRQGR